MDAWINESVSQSINHVLFQIPHLIFFSLKRKVSGKRQSKLHT